MKLVLGVVVGLAAVVGGSPAVGSTAGHGVTRSSPPAYVVAAVPVGTWGGTRSLVPSLDVRLCTPPFDPHLGVGSCLPAAPMLRFAPITNASQGATIWHDASAPAFANVAGSISDAVPGYIGWAVLTETGFSATTEPESRFFAGAMAASGVDLAPYAIQRIGFRVDAVSLSSPGSDPNGDGLWTDWAISGTFLFEGRIADAATCKHGGWEALRGPAGRFRNQGDCIRSVNTGK